METEFRAIVHSEYGAPEKVLKIAKRQLKSEELGVDDVLVKVIARPIHPGDIQILSALRQGGSGSGESKMPALARGWQVESRNAQFVSALPGVTS